MLDAVPAVPQMLDPVPAVPQMLCQIQTKMNVFYNVLLHCRMGLAIMPDFEICKNDVNTYWMFPSLALQRPHIAVQSEATGSTFSGVIIVGVDDW